jgi:rhamnogalacturonyl hydrolase YesR
MAITTYEKVKTAMLAIQRYPWEQGVCAQAMFEAGENAVFIAMAHDAVLRQTPDGRLAVTGNNIAVTDPAANGEAVWRAYEHTGDVFFKEAAERMLSYLMKKAPRTSSKAKTASNLICHNDISFHEGYSPQQIWVDSCYMLPPFLAVMGETDEARKQMNGYLDCLTDSKTGLLYHIYDAGTGRFVRKKLWGTGNGWALMGLARIGDYERGRQLLDSILRFSFNDILDDPNSFTDATCAMMTAVFIYRGIAEGRLECEYLKHAELVYENIQDKIDDYGIIRGVCGCPHFNSPGTSAEAQAAYIMMQAWRKKGRKNYEIRQISESIAFNQAQNNRESSL